MNIDIALELTMPYIKHISHDSRLYDKEDIIQEGMIAAWLTLEKIDDDFEDKAKVAFIKRAIRWRVDNFIMDNLVHVKIGRTKLRLLIKQGVDVIAKYRALPCSTFDGFEAREFSPYKQACFNEGLKFLKNKEDVGKYI